jgi:hypothetical protein
MHNVGLIMHNVGLIMHNVWLIMHNVWLIMHNVGLIMHNKQPTMHILKRTKLNKLMLGDKKRSILWGSKCNLVKINLL